MLELQACISNNQVSFYNHHYIKLYRIFVYSYGELHASVKVYSFELAIFQFSLAVASTRILSISLLLVYITTVSFTLSLLKMKKI